MASSNSPSPFQTELDQCPYCECPPYSALADDFYTGNFCRCRPPILNEQYSRVPTDIEQSLTLGEPIDISADGSSTIDGDQSNTESITTIRSPNMPVPLRIQHALHQYDRSIGAVLPAPNLSENNVATLSNPDSHPFCNIFEWARPQPGMHAFSRLYHIATIREELSDSMIAAANSAASSHSGLSGASSYFLISHEAEESNTTDPLVRAAGGQFDDVTTSPFAFEEVPPVRTVDPLADDLWLRLW